MSVLLLLLTAGETVFGPLFIGCANVGDMGSLGVVGRLLAFPLALLSDALDERLEGVFISSMSSSSLSSRSESSLSEWMIARRSYTFVGSVGGGSATGLTSEGTPEGKVGEVAEEDLGRIGD